MVDAYDYLFKFLIIGDAGTGKSCLLRRFLDDTFREESLHTIGVEFGTKIVQISAKNLKLQIWDTAGQERFQCVTRSYYRGAAGALVVYDITCRDSFNRVADWIASARELARPELVIILIGNKVDLCSESREISELEAREFANENGVAMFLETSAKSGDNVQEAFITGARTVLERVRASNTADIFSPTSTGPVNPNAANIGKRNSECSC